MDIDFARVFSTVLRAFPDSWSEPVAEPRIAELRAKFSALPDEYWEFLRSIGEGRLANLLFYPHPTRAADWSMFADTPGLDGFVLIACNCLGWFLAYDTGPDGGLAALDSGSPAPAIPLGRRGLADFLLELCRDYAENRPRNGPADPLEAACYAIAPDRMIWRDQLRARFPNWGDAENEFDYHDVKDKFPIGQPVEAIVIARAPFGVWVDTGLGYPALLLAQDLDEAQQRELEPGQGPALGDRLKARVVERIDGICEIRISQRTAGKEIQPGGSGA